MTKYSLKQRIVDFFCSDGYLTVLAFVIVVFWATGQEVAGTVIIVLSACFYMFIGDDLKPVAATIMLITMVYSLKQIKSTAFLVMLGILIPIIAVSFVYNFVKFRKVRTYKKGKLYYPMAIAYVSALCAGMFFSKYDAKWTFVVMGVGFFIYLLYFICINCVKGDKRIFFCKVVFYAGIIAAVETLLWFLFQADIMEAIKCKTLRLGWGMSNTIPVFFVMAVPASVYLGIKDKRCSYIVFPTAIVFAVLLTMTLSRGNILFGLPIISASLVYGFIKFEQSARIVALASLGITAVLVAVSFAFGSFGPTIFDKLLHSHTGGFFDDNGRRPLYQKAVENFLAHPVFGVGYFKSVGVPPMFDSSNADALTFLWKVHNTVLQILACSGIVGFVGIIPFFVARYRLLVFDVTDFKILALLAVLAYEAEGMVDVAFLSVHQLFLCIGLFAAAEWECKPRRNCKEMFALRKIPSIG